MRRVLARFRQRTLLGLPAPDVALAALLCAIAVMSVLTGNPDEGPMALTLPVALVSTLALAWRRRLPLVMIGLVAVAGLVQTLLAQMRDCLEKEIGWIDDRVAGGDKMREEWREKCRRQTDTTDATPSPGV